MGSIDKQKVKERGTLMGSAGLVLALAVACLLNYVGFRTISVAGSLWALGATVLVQAALRLAGGLRCESRLTRSGAHFSNKYGAASTAQLTRRYYLSHTFPADLLMAELSKLILL